jgi:hypothetical protein
MSSLFLFFVNKLLQVHSKNAKNAAALGWRYDD